MATARATASLPRRRAAGAGTAVEHAHAKEWGASIQDRFHPPEKNGDMRREYGSMRDCRSRDINTMRLANGAWLRRRMAALLVTGGFASLGRAEGVLDPQGPIAAAERLILLDSTAIMLVIVVPVIVLTLAFAWWYRASNSRAAYDPDWAHSGRIEFVVWSIPAMVVLLLAGVAWTSSHDLDPARKLASNLKPIRIEVVSLDWKWLFIYPDFQVATLNQIVVPTGVPIEFLLTSTNVMDAFWVPQLGSQIYTMPGMTTHLNLLAERSGDYSGVSSNFSGDGFSDMRFVVHAVPAAGFSSWLTAMQGQGSARMEMLDADAYAQLARSGTDVSVKTYRGVEPGLFERIERESIGAAAGPMEK
jgi:cytochrome o ubiquinol oxidase subunit 2